MVDPLVSICCITFNHESYIRECLNGFLMQKTNFQFEIIIHDDASTDDTSTIIKSYQEKYPNIIKTILQTENQYSKGVKAYPNFVFPSAKGKYIAMCEGDDYWTDPLKLQRQVDFLEENEDYALTCGGYIEKKGSHTRDVIFSNGENVNEGFSFGLEQNNKLWMTKTLTLLFRKKCIEELPMVLPKFKYFRDTHLVYFLLRNSKGYYFKRVFGVFNVHSGGVNSMTSLDHKYKTAYKIRDELYNYSPDIYNSNLYMRKAMRLTLWSLKTRQKIDLKMVSNIPLAGLRYLKFIIFNKKS